MASSMILTFAFLCFSTVFDCSYALYEDQAGTFDWRQQYIGRAKFLSWDQSRQTGKRIFVGTEKNVVALINVQTGTLVWRQVMESDDGSTVDALLHHSNVLISVSGGGAVIRGWNTGSGVLQWEQYLFSSSGEQRASITWANDSKDKLAVLSFHTVGVYLVSNGKPVWTVTLPTSDSIIYDRIVTHDDGLILLGGTPGSHISILRYTNEGALKQQQNVPADWFMTNSRCEVLADKYLVCFDADSQALLHADIHSGETFYRTTLQELDLPQAGAMTFDKPEHSELIDGHFVVKLSSTHTALLRVIGSTVTLVKDLPSYSATWVGYSDGNPIILAVKRLDDELVSLTAFDVTTGGELVEYTHSLNIADFHGHAEVVCPLWFKKRDGRMAYRAVITFSDYSIQLVQAVGKIGWRREEALAYVVATEMVDLPVSENDAKFEDEFGTRQSDVLAMFMTRVRTQISQLKTVVNGWVVRVSGHKAHSHPSHLSEEYVETEATELTRDPFSIHKMIVLVTSVGKIYGMLSASGKIVWQQLLPDLAPFERFGTPTFPLFVQRSSAHFTHPPQCALLGRHKVTGKGLLYVFNPMTGERTSDMPVGGEHLAYVPIQAAMTGVIDKHFLKTIIVIDEALKVYTYPAHHSESLTLPSSSVYLYNVDIGQGVLSGYRVVSSGGSLSLEEIWTVNLQRGHHITNVVGKRAIEHVHSQGRVLGDRSVLYKYLNPNLIAVTTEGEDKVVVASPMQKGPSKFVSVYLIDAVTGRIVFQTNHKRASGPVHLVHSENWIVYNYYNQKARRGELAVLEMYEGKHQSNTSVFSAFHASHQPLVMRQAYIFPQPISSMAVSITEKGIASKTVILALKSGSLLSLQKTFLDPRRPVIPKPEHMEEGTIPYMPEIGVAYDAVFNYNMSIFNVRSVLTVPAGLESTCLVLAYGLDLFFSHVMPSKLFDVLNEDFDYFFISSVLTGMFLVSLITQKLASRKALSRLWK